VFCRILKLDVQTWDPCELALFLEISGDLVVLVLWCFGFREFPVAVAFPLSQGLLAGRLRELRSLREKGHTKGEDDELDE
jgi:hypothetical protein